MAVGAWSNTGQYQRIHQLYEQRPSSRGYHPLVHNTSWRKEETNRIFREHDSFFVNTAIGHRNYKKFGNHVRKAFGTLAIRAGSEGDSDLVNHISHLLVLRKRLTPRSTVVQVQTGTRAMKGAAVWHDPVVTHKNTTSGVVGDVLSAGGSQPSDVAQR